MRLLHVIDLEIHEFNGWIPPYAILSHTWLSSGEATFQDFQKGREQYSGLAGFPKIRGSCEEAARNDIKWIWIDTCCIDRTNHTELSEAINSMFVWYKNAKVCYVYLADVRTEGGSWARRRYDEALISSRWFTRGWTLQELLAPKTVEFFDARWRFIGTRRDLEIGHITGIDKAFLDGRPLADASVAQRMSWASQRSTTKKEDMAYSLLGIFGVSMPLIYGEGDRAFIRLQEEILKMSNDPTLFAWDIDENCRQTGHIGEIGILATSPKNFRFCRSIVPGNSLSNTAWLNLALQGGFTFHTPVVVDETSNTVWMLLNAYRGMERIAIPLYRPPGTTVHMRLPLGHSLRIPNSLLSGLSTRTIHVLRNMDKSVAYPPSDIQVCLNMSAPLTKMWRLWAMYPHRAAQKWFVDGSVHLSLNPSLSHPTYIWLGCWTKHMNAWWFDGAIIRLNWWQGINNKGHITAELDTIHEPTVNVPSLVRETRERLLELDPATSNRSWTGRKDIHGRVVSVQVFATQQPGWDWLVNLTMTQGLNNKQTKTVNGRGLSFRPS